MSEKIVLIDGHSVLNRAFYGIPDLTNAEGLHTNAIYGFLNILFKTMEDEKPDYLAVAFDVHAPTFRHELYKEYKGTRKKMPEELREQVPVMKEVLKAMGIAIMEQAGMEADDLIGTVAKQWEKEGREVSVLSGDRDLLQLATERIKIRIPKTKQGRTETEEYLAADVKERYQVTPEEFIDVKALMGDASDNIPGVPGIGEKTATKIIVSYKNIETAYEHIDEITPARMQNAFREHYDLAQLSKVLATINTECGFELAADEARLGDVYTEEAYAFFRELEFKNLLGRFSQEAPVNKIEANFQQISELGAAQEVFKKAAAAEKLGLYVIEEKATLLGLALAFGETDIYWIKAEGLLTAAYLLDQLQEIIARVPVVCVQDLKATLRFITAEDEQKFFDTGIAAYLLNPLKNHYTYDDLGKEYMGLLALPQTELIGKLSFTQAQETKEAEFLRFVCYHAYIAWGVREAMLERLKETGMEQLFYEVEMPLIFTLSEMEKEGIQTEGAELNEYSRKLQLRLTELEQSIYATAGHPFNINSPKQLGVILFEEMKMPHGKKTKTGYSTAADVLEKLAAEYPFVSDILEYRQLAKLKSTYADGLPVFIQADGRIHSSFNQTITATGRISSTEPNLQNIPIRMELGRLIRKVFVPRDGYVFVDADYSQIELRVLAHMSGDEALIQAYREAQDIHQLTASQVFHVPFDEVTPLQRRNAKAVNFGIVYGISSFGLSEDLSITRKEAKEYIDKYFETYPKIKGFLDGLVSQAKEDGYVTTMFGRRRPVPELKSGNFMQRSFGERVAMNAPIQGTAADIIKIAMNRVRERLAREQLRSRLILQIHDELLIEAHAEEAERVKVLLEEEMKHAADLSVPLEVDVHTGKNWYEAK